MLKFKQLCNREYEKMIREHFFKNSDLLPYMIREQVLLVF